MAEQPSTRKVQITVPTADTSVVEWLTMQHSASESMRRLIRESVAREGFIDVANRPVRPPAQPVYVAEALPFEEESHLEEDDASPVAVTPAATRRSQNATPRAQKENANASATIDDLLGL